MCKQCLISEIFIPVKPCFGITLRAQRANKAAANLRQTDVHQLYFKNHHCKLTNFSGITCTRRKEPAEAQDSLITLINYLPNYLVLKKLPTFHKKKKKNRIKSELDNYLKSELIFLFIREREPLTHHIS